MGFLALEREKREVSRESATCIFFKIKSTCWGSHITRSPKGYVQNPDSQITLYVAAAGLAPSSPDNSPRAEGGICSAPATWLRSHVLMEAFRLGEEQNCMASGRIRTGGGWKGSMSVAAVETGGFQLWSMRWEDGGGNQESMLPRGHSGQEPKQQGGSLTPGQRSHPLIPKPDILGGGIETVDEEGESLLCS